MSKSEIPTLQEENNKEVYEKMKTKQAKKRKLLESHDEVEPDFLGAALKKTRKSESNEMPTSYEDLGDKEIKTERDSTVTGASFDISLTKDEKRRRKERQVGPTSDLMLHFVVWANLTEYSFLYQMRFTNCVVMKDDAPDALSSALSASRSSSTTKSPNTKKKPNGSYVVGTCQNLEKPYLRLTTFPKPEQVRPLEVLSKSLQHIKCRYIRDEDFEWANEQLKSVRQDITVQGLQNNFVLDVYETHARILLENGDLNEYNQCQTVIRTLTSTGWSHDNDDFVVPPKETDLLKQSDSAADEFGGYRLLYALVQNSRSDLTQELAQTRQLIRRQGESATKSSNHAVLVVKAVTHNDYHGFFRLYESAPHLSAYLMDFLVKRVRAGAYERIIAAYRPMISVEHFREALFFKDMEETREFLRSSGAVFVDVDKGEPSFWVDTKASKG